MIQQTECRPVFFYAYRPLVQSFKEDPLDGGYTVTLYEDNRLVFCIMDAYNEVRTQQIYDVPSDLKFRYRDLLAHYDVTISSLPPTLMDPNPYDVRFLSLLGVEGYPLVYCQDLPHLCHLPFSSPEGRCARRLTVFLEDLAELIKTFGFTFALHYFEPNPVVQQPEGAPAAQDSAAVQDTGTMGATSQIA